MKTTFMLIGLSLMAAMAAVAQDEPEPPQAADILALAAPPKRAATPMRGTPPKRGTQKPAAKKTDIAASQPMSPAFTPGLVRIKDIATVQGVRGNQLIGYGLVVGLEGTGDGQNSIFTVQSVINMLRKFGVSVSVSPQQLQVKNVAAVMVTADLPPFVREGSRIDVMVSSIGDAKSLQGGTLLQTPLRAANGDVYAAAQGALSIGGFNFGQGGSSVQKNHVNVGRIPRGAIVEQAVPTTLSENGGTVEIVLSEPDFTTASRIASAIRRQLPEVGAQARDAATVAVPVPPDQAADLVAFLARIETVSVTPDSQARIVVNERTGTIVMGGNVRVAPGAIAHGAISVKIENTPVVVPAPPFSRNGQATVVPFKETRVKEPKAQIAAIPQTTTVDQLVRALNTLGVTPRELITILQGMRSVGMLPAEIEVQ